MAKLRRNHGSGKGKSRFGESLVRIIVLFLLIGVAMALLYPSAKRALSSESDADYNSDTHSETGADREFSGIDRLYLPTGPSDQVVHHTYYSLGYDEDWEQPRWVAYRLSPKQVRNRRVKRTSDFRPDDAVRTGSAVRNDYRRSGYSRGHMVPAGDMAFDETAMSETFFYSNMSPQLASYNGGIWRELEENTRDWVLDRGATYVVSGPIVTPRPRRIGDNEVAIPEAFYRVLLRENGEAIGFVIPHETQSKRLADFAMTIDEVEKATQLDFFPELEDLATPQAESTFDLSEWPDNDRRYKQRLNSWNKQR